MDLNTSYKVIMDINCLDMLYDLLMHHLDEEPYSLFRSYIIEKYNDPVVNSQCNGYSMKCRFSHKLPYYQYLYPMMNKQLKFVCRYIMSKTNKNPVIVDVGANVGDSVLNIGIKDAQYICVEGNHSFSDLLKDNLNAFNYTLDEVYITDTGEEKGRTINDEGGTARLVEDNSADIELISLDELIMEKHKDIKKIDLLKIDTDGYDFRVIRSSKKLLERDKPIIFFEWDRKYLEDVGEDYLSIFPIIKELGYSKVLLFDHVGEVLYEADSDDIGLLKATMDYCDKSIDSTCNRRINYFDVLCMNDESDFSYNEFLREWFLNDVNDLEDGKQTRKKNDIVEKDISIKRYQEQATKLWEDISTLSKTIDDKDLVIKRYQEQVTKLWEDISTLSKTIDEKDLIIKRFQKQNIVERFLGINKRK